MELWKKQCLAAFVMGAILPWAVFRIGAAVVLQAPEETTGNTEQTQESQIPEETMSQTEPVTTPTQFGEVKMQISVLHNGGTEEMELDDYITGVVLAEMPASFGVEALKAQAVAARTYTLLRIDERPKHEGGAVCTSFACCQAYCSPQEYLERGGLQENAEKVALAVATTAGEYLTYNGAIIDATYFSCSGGKTEDAVAVWGADVPYLQSVESPGEEHAGVYQETVTFTVDAFGQAMGIPLPSDSSAWFGKTEYTRGGGVATMEIAGEVYTGTKLRSLLKLNSTAFTVAVKDGEISVTTFGYGHRVGMSQYGADAMASAGSTYQEILAHYYWGTRIDKLDAVG